MYGEHLRQQVENRLKFYETGETPAKNADVMKQAEAEVCLCVFVYSLIDSHDVIHVCCEIDIPVV